MPRRAPVVLVSQPDPTLLSRRRWSRLEAVEIIDHVEASGLSLTAFAELHGLDVKRLSRARARVRHPVVHDVVHDEPDAIQLLPVSLTQADPRPSLDLHVGPVRIPVGPDFDPPLLRAVVAALGATC